MFGLQVPGGVPAQLGHYFVANPGCRSGWSAALRTTVASRVQGSVEYT
jgi:hypothetical protein